MILTGSGIEIVIKTEMLHVAYVPQPGRIGP